ncbi:MAG TPA: DUF5924 family protein [Gammaproteobacteria bacterium]|nr:DUF5924 family protein [Gammaproteobacteria bacterium]
MTDHARRALANRKLTKLIERGMAVHARAPWIVPLVSFLAGWLGFVLVRRGEATARWVALFALLGWPWLLVEPFVRRFLERRKRGIGNFFSNMVSQSLQQELLFFSLPLVIGATQWDLGHIAFTTLAASAALVSTVDPVYERMIAKRAPRRLFFHAYCSWIAALVVLPMVLHLAVEQALPVSLAAVFVSLVLTLPMSLRALKTWPPRIAWIVSLVAIPTFLWTVRGELPAAGLVVTQARITQSVEALVPGEPVSRLTVDDLPRGVIAFAAIRAPSGLSQTVIFQWKHGAEIERIVAEIHGGRAEGFRLYARKRVFPADPLGRWTVDLLTPQGQLLKRLRFTVVPSRPGDGGPAPGTAAPDAPATIAPSGAAPAP